MAGPVDDAPGTTATATPTEPDRATGRGPDPGRDAARAWWTVAGLTVLLWAFQLYGYVDSYPVVSLAVVVLGLWGLGTVLAVWQPRRPGRWTGRVLAGTTVALTVGGFGVWSLLQILGAPAYGTDEIAFDQYAAELLHRGVDPYTHSMAPAFSLFHVSPDGYTFLLNGHAVTSLSYPALSFLLYAPFVALGWTTQMAVAVNVVAWALGIVLLYVLLPRAVRPLALVVGSLGVYVSYAVGGVTDALFVPLLIGAVYRWDRFPTARGWVAWRGPVLLGLAMAVKQTPWLVLPFLVAGVAHEARRVGTPASAARTTARYLGIALGAFLVPNLPFLVWAPHAWLSGVLTPIASHTVPAGQGLVGLSLYLGVGGGSLEAFTLALVVVFVTLWVVFTVTYPSLKPWAVLCPSVVLFFSARSFGSYLITLVPAMLVAAATARPTDPDTSRPRRRLAGPARVAVAGCLVATGVAVAGVLTSTAPLAVRLQSVRTTGQLATVVQLGVEVTNRTDRTTTPSFSVESGGQLTAFWLTGAGPADLGPGASAHYTLLAPNFFAQPPISGGFQIVAFTSAPGTVSRSATYAPTTWHVGLVPDAVNRVVPVGQPVTVQAELLDKLNRGVTVAGVPIYLGQVIYSQAGLQYGQAVINQGQVGQTPVVAYTDGRGIATFVLRGTQSRSDPVYFEANLVNGSQYYPYGYSEILPVRFGR